MNDNPNQYNIREYPTQSLIFGLALILTGLYLYWRNGQWIALAIPLGIVLLILLLSTVLNVQADRLTGTLSIAHRGLLRRTQRQIYFNEIESIQLGRSVRNDEGSKSTSYRVEIWLNDGSVVPLRTSYSSGRKKKTETVEALRAFIGVSGAPTSVGGMIDLVSQVARSQIRVGQEAMTGDQVKIHETEGVRWQVESLSAGASPNTRWLAPDHALPDHFLYLAQKLEGQKSNKLMQMVSENFLSPSLLLNLYGFDESDTPGIENAETVALDRRLDTRFTALASDERTIRPILDAWARTSLSAWAEKYPLKQGSSDQLIVLLGPNGLYLAVSGHVAAERLEELANLGVALALKVCL